VPIAGFWSGHVAMNLNLLPFIGRLGKRRNVVASLGYCGHGVSHSLAVLDRRTDRLATPRH
jgi:glycine/D-amino acid oxidase-like deaminating enzyme